MLLLAGVLLGSSLQTLKADPTDYSWKSIWKQLGDEGGKIVDGDGLKIKMHKVVRRGQSWKGLRGASVLAILVWFVHQWEAVKDPYYLAHPELVAENEAKGLTKMQKLRQSYGIGEIWQAFFKRNAHNLTLGVLGEKGSTNVMSVVITYLGVLGLLNTVNQFKLHGFKAK
jgi:hypothetical protein